jgi:DNA-binding HxlR family transcriptional regulator
MQATRKVSSSNFQNQRVLGSACVLNDTLYRIGMRWKMQVLYTIAHGERTFGALKRSLPNVSDHVLAKRLRELLDEQLIDKLVAGPRRTSYVTTARGAALLSIMADICAWEMASPRTRA